MQRLMLLSALITLAVASTSWQAIGANDPVPQAVPAFTEAEAAALRAEARLERSVGLLVDAAENAQGDAIIGLFIALRAQQPLSVSQ